MHTPLLQMILRQTEVNSLVQGHKTMSDGVGDEAPVDAEPPSTGPALDLES